MIPPEIKIMKTHFFASPVAGLRITAAAVLVCASAGAQAFDDKWSGFGSLVAGQTFGACTEGELASAFNDNCTRYIADWSHAGIYDDKASIRPESRVGLQWTGNFTDSLSATAQGVARLGPGQKADLEWAYLTDKISSSWTVQVGRKRLPLYYYSDFQDVGYAYSMIRPSPDVYGWDVVNYDGANVDYSTDIGDWSLRATGYAGGEDSRKNKYSLVFSDQAQELKWKDIVGSSLELSNDWLTLRASYTQSGFQQIDPATGAPQQLASGAYTGHQKFYGVAANVDWQDWQVRSELAATNRHDQGYKATFGYVDVGRRIGQFMPTVGYSVYREQSTVGADYVPEYNRTVSAALRYEVTKSSDLKLQFDHDLDHSAVIVTGDAKVVSIAYDFVF